MGTDPDPKPDDPKPDPKPDDPKPDDPDAGAKAALESERKARRDAEKQLKDVQAKLKEIEDKDKSEGDKLRDDLAAATKERDDHATKAMRLEVAMEKGLSAAQAKRLVGATREELEADADEILEAFPASGTGGGGGSGKEPPSPKPKPDLKTGTDPTGSSADVKSLIDSIPPTA